MTTGRHRGRHRRALFQHGLKRQFAEWHAPRCPPVLGIDEHFFTRRQGYATTFCDLRNHKVYDVVLGRSEAALESYLERLEGKAEVRLICMDLASTYCALAHFIRKLSDYVQTITPVLWPTASM